MVGGNPEVEINSQEELDIANYGTHGKKTGKKPAARPNLKKSEAEAKKLEESYVPRRKFAINEENEKKGVNKRYIIADEVSQDKLNERWNQLCKFTKDESIEEKEVISESVVLGLGFESDETAEKTVSREEGEIQNEKEFEQNNLETPAASNSEECDDFEMIDKASPKGEVSSLAVYKIDKQDLQENKAYVIDHFTKKLVLNPKYDSKK